MNILMISDEPEKQAFVQISSLKKEIQGIGRNKVDVFIFSEDGIYFNKKRIGKEASMALKSLESPILSDKTYGLIIISLNKSNLKELFSKKRNILDLIENFSPQTDIFIFGASSVLNELTVRDKEKIRVFLYPRPGVSKLTTEFRSNVIDYVRRKE